MSAFRTNDVGSNLRYSRTSLVLPVQRAAPEGIAPTNSPSTPTGHPATSMARHQSPPTFAASLQTHLRPPPLSTPIVDMNHHLLCRCHSPFQAFLCSSLTQQALSLSQTHRRRTQIQELTSRTATTTIASFAVALEPGSLLPLALRAANTILDGSRSLIWLHESDCSLVSSFCIVLFFWTISRTTRFAFIFSYCFLDPLESAYF